MLDKVIGLDLGTKTLGIAYSDSFGFVHGIETFRFDRNQYIVARKHVLELAEKMGINEIAIGLPLHLSGGMSEMAENVMRFRDDLLKENPSLIINTVDERLTSVIANNSISEQGFNHKKRVESVDRIAACIILDTYIRMKENNNVTR